MYLHKRITIFALSIFLVLYPIIEGVSNQFFALGNTITAFVVIFFWSYETIRLRKVHFGISILCLLILVFWTVTSFFWSLDQQLTIKRIFSLVPIVIIYFALVDSVITERELLVIFRNYVLGTILLSFTALYNIINGITYQGLYNRFSAVGYDPNNFGIYLISSVPLLKYYVHYVSPRKMYLAWLYYIFAVIIAISTGSRGALIALFFVTLYMILSEFNYNSNVRKYLNLFIFLLGTIVFVYFAFLFFIPSEAVDRLVLQFSNVTNDSRAGVWQNALSIWSDHWLLGSGAGTTIDISDDGIQAHNTFISYFAELGTIGGLLWLAAWLIHGYLAVSIYKYNKPLSLALICSLICILIGALTLNWESRKALYIIWAFILIAKRIYSGPRIESNDNNFNKFLI